VAGVPFHILVEDEDSKLPATTHRTLRLPDSLPDQGFEQSAGIYRAMILQQLAPLLFGTHLFSLAPDRELVQVPQAEPSGEVRGDLQIFFSRFSRPAIARRLFYLCEAIRGDACIRTEFPGILPYLRLANSQRLDNLDHTASNPAAAGDSSILELLYDALVLLECSPEANFSIQALGPELSALCEQARKLRAPAASVADSTKIASAMMALLQNSTNSDDALTLDELAEEQQPGNVLAEMVQQEQAVAGLEFALLSLDEQLEITPGDTPGSQSIMRALEGERDNLQRRINMQRARMARAAPATDLSETRSFLYDEWDYLANSYIRGWCRLFEKQLEPGDPEELAQLERRLGTLARAVRKQFEHIRPVSLERIRPLEEGEEIYLDALIAHEIDRRCGQVNEARVYSTNARKKREIATAFLVDLSASTDDTLTTPQASDQEPVGYDEHTDNTDALEADACTPLPEERRIIDVLREALWLMSKALAALGDDFGIYGFSGYGHDEVEVFVVKELGQALTGQVLRTIPNMRPRRSTRMGPAIRHAIKKLCAHHASRRLLILVSDGFPQDCDYGPTRGDHEYGLQDTARALLEAQVAGVETFCITVDTSGHDYLHRMCPEQRYLVIEEVEDLPLALTKVYRKLAF
jgi:hypothetical protein